MDKIVNLEIRLDELLTLRDFLYRVISLAEEDYENFQDNYKVEEYLTFLDIFDKVHEKIVNVIAKINKDRSQDE